MNINEVNEVTIGRFTYRPETIWDPIEKTQRIKASQVFDPTNKEVDYMVVKSKEEFHLAVIYLRLKNDKKAK